MDELKIDKKFAKRLSIMIHSHLINYKYFFLWTDSLIINDPDVPKWILDLSCTKYYRGAIEVINLYIYSEPYEELNENYFNNEYICCELLRYERKEISWATFLHNVGNYSDGYQCKHVCEYFYDCLNQFEESRFNKELEFDQYKNIFKEYKDFYFSIKQYYEMFDEFYSKYLFNKGYDSNTTSNCNDT